MKEGNNFFNSIKDIENPEIVKGIESGDPYIICDFLEEIKGGPNGVYLKRLEDAIIATNDIVQIYEFMFLAVDMGIHGFDRAKFEGIIRESGNPKFMCYCTGFVPGTNIEEMLKAIKETKNAKYMEMLLENEEYEEVLEEIRKIDPQYEESVEEAKKFDYFPKSLDAFRGLKDNIKELKQEIISTENPHLITELANYIEYLNKYKDANYDIDDLTKAQEEIQDPMQAYEYLASVNVENKTGLIQSVIKSNNAKFMYYIHEYVPGLTEEEKELLKESIIAKDSKGKYKAKIQEGAGEGKKVPFRED